MHAARLAVSLVAGAFTLAACSTTASDAPQRALRPTVASHLTASNGIADTLHVAIAGRATVFTASSQRYTANLSNGTATSYGQGFKAHLATLSP